jgi:hypothetical protein
MGVQTMQITIQRENGARVDGVLLAAERGWMRVALRDRTDTVDLVEHDGVWLEESDGRVEIDAILRLEFAAQPRTMTAGGLS